MENSFYIGLSNQLAARRQLDVIANNLANMNTTAYKSESMMFAEYLQESENGQKVSYVQDIALFRNLKEGSFAHTGNDLDLAISGNGFFEVETEVGPQYTRNGSFGLNAEGEIITSSGARLLDDGDQPFVLPPGSGRVMITKDGTVSTKDGPIGRIRIVQFDNEQNLQKLSNSLYDANGEEPKPAENVELLQGTLEESNVTGIIELTRMISAARGYKAAASLLKQENQRQREAIQILGSKSA